MLEFGPYRLDPAQGSLTKHGTPIRLRGMPLKILQHLAERPGEVVTRVELKGLLWNGTAYGEFEQGLNTAVNSVRKTLGDSADQPIYIETITGQGYRFVAPVRAPEHQEPEKPKQTASRRFWIAGCCGLVLVAVSAWWMLRPTTPVLLDRAVPSANPKANDQYNLGFHFVAYRNDIVEARKAFARALELDPQFASARLQHALAIVLEILNGYTNDERGLIQAEADLHLAETSMPASEGLLLAAQTGVHLVQGRLDRVPFAQVEKATQAGTHPAWGVVLRMLREQQAENSEVLLRQWNERFPVDNPPRMLLGELQRLRGDTVAAIATLERVFQQGAEHPAAIWFLTMAYLDAGQPGRARALQESKRASFERNYMWRHARALTLAVEGRGEAALAAMDSGTLKWARLCWDSTATTADFYALLGDRAKAIEWLQLAISRGDERISYFRRNPRLALLRDDPAFQSMLKSVAARRQSAPSAAPLQ